MTVTSVDGNIVWAPEELPIAKDELGSWSYIVLEEIIDGVVLLQRWGWPVVDQLGRLRWLGGAEYDTQGVTVSLELLRVQLYEPNEIEREPRCGDVFAALIEPDAQWEDERDTDDLRELMPGPVYDISAVAREAVKIAYQSSLGVIAKMDAADEEAKTDMATTMRHRMVQPLPVLRVAALPPRSTHQDTP